MKSWFVVHVTAIDCGAFHLNQASFGLPALLSTMSKIKEIFSIKWKMELIQALTIFLLNLITSDTAPALKLSGKVARNYMFFSAFHASTEDG